MFEFLNAAWWAYHPNPLLHQSTVIRNTFEPSRVTNAIYNLLATDPLSLSDDELLKALHDLTYQIVQRNWHSDSIPHYFYFNIKSSVDFIFNCIFLFAASRHGNILVRTDFHIIATILNKVAFKIVRDGRPAYVKMDLNFHNSLQSSYLVISEEAFQAQFSQRNLIIAETTYSYNSRQNEVFRGEFEFV